MGEPVLSAIYGQVSPSSQARREQPVDSGDDADDPAAVPALQAVR